MVLSQKVGNIPLQSPKSLSVSLPYQHPPTHPHNTSYALASTSCYKSFIIGLCAEPADLRVNKCLYLVRWFREAAQRRFWFWLRAAKLFLPALLEPKHWWMSRPFLMRTSFHCQTCTASEWTLTRQAFSSDFEIRSLWWQCRWRQFALHEVIKGKRVTLQIGIQRPARAHWQHTGMDQAMETWVLQSSLGAGTSVLSYF